MKLIILNCFFLSLKLNAFEIVRNESKVLLRDTSCSQVKEMASTLIEWTKNIGEEKNCPPLTNAKMSVESGGACELDITQCIPNHVAEFQGVHPQHFGPNCWNLALVMKKILPNLRYTTPDEMAYYMRPPLCRQLKNDEKKIPGDLGAIRDVYEKDAIESHGFIYISEKMAYSKNGYSNEQPYSLQKLENVYKVYGVPDRAECRTNELSKDQTCYKAVSYFRCISMDEYLKNNPQLPSEILNSFKNITAFEGCLQNSTFNGILISLPAEELILQSSNAILSYLKNELKNSNRNSEQNFILGSIKLRLEAISSQLSYSQEYNLSNQVEQFSKEINRSLSLLKGNSL